MSKVILTFRDPINLINNLTTNQAGLGALDASMGKDIYMKLYNASIAPPSYGSGNLNLTYVSTSSSVFYRVVNGLCFCRYDLNVTVSLPDSIDTTIITNIPRPTIIPYHISGNWDPNGNKRILLRVNPDGSMACNGCTVGYYVGSFVYPII